MKKSLPTLLFLLFLAVSREGWGQVSLTGTSYSQDFNSFTAPSSSLPTGWRWSKDASTLRTINTAWSAAITGTIDNTMPTSSGVSCASNNGSYYASNTSGGSAGSDKCLGFLSSSSATKNGNLYLGVTNSTGASINSFTVTYSAKKFRNGSNAAGFSISMYYSTNGTTWTAMGTNFNAVFTADANNFCPTSGTSVGNVPSATTTITSQTYTPGSAVANASTIYFAWNYCVTANSTTSNAQLLGVDDVTISTVPPCTAPTTPACTTPSAVCSGNSATITGAGSTGATAYTYWTASSGGSAITTSTTPPGTVSSNNLTTPTSLAAGTYNYYVQGETGSCVSSSRQQVTVTINATPTTPNCSTPAAVCTGTAATITGAGSTNATTYTYWDASTGGNQITTSTTPPGTVTSGNMTTPTTLATGTYTYYVQGENTNCTSTSRQAVTVTVSDAPTTPTCSTPPNVCLGNTATITGAGAGGSATYTYWDAASGGNQITTGNPTGTVVSGGNLTTPSTLSVGTHNYYVQGEVGSCISSRQLVTITVVALPADAPNPTATSTLACNSTTLTEGTSAGVTYYWQGTSNGGATPSSANSSTTYSATVANTNTYYVRARDNTTLCWSPAASAGNVSVTILTSAPSTPSFSSGATSVCQGASSSYAIGTVTGAVDYTWSLSTAGSSSISPSSPTTSTTATVTWDATYTGSATVSVSARNVCGSSSAATRVVTVYPPAVANFTTATATNNNPAPCPGTTGLTYSVTNVSGTTYAWSAGSLAGWNITGGATTATATITAGTASGNITVTATNACGSVTATISVAPPNSSLSAPVANSNTSPQTGANPTDFTANWSAVTGATSGYLLEVSTSATFGTTTNMSDLIISEYVEGSGSNKYIEIYNGTGSSVNLSDYRLRCFANGAGIGSPTNDVLLSGTLNNGSTIVYEASGASAYTGTRTVNAACNFNGDDAVALYKISTSSYVDIIGEIGVDPGTAWTSGSFSTLDKTLVRKSTVTGGITTNPTGLGFQTLATEWNQSNVDVVSNLGSHSHSGTTPSFVTGYDGTTLITGTSQLVNGSEILQNSTYYYRVRAVNPCDTSGYSNVVQVVTPACTPPAAPNGSIGQSAACGSNTLTYTPTSTPADIVYYWQTTSSGTSASSAAGGTANTYTATSTSAIYVRAYNTVSHCWSASINSGAVSILTVPAQPTLVTTTTPVCALQTGATYSVTTSGATGFNWSYSGNGESITPGSLGSITIDFDADASSGNVVATPTNSCGSGTPLNIAVVVYSNTVSGTSPQTIETGVNGSALSVSETPVTGVTRIWNYSTTQGGPYTAFSPSQTGTSYTPNFASVGTYYVVCESTWGGSCVSTSEEKQIIVIAPGPPVITHTAVANTSSTTAQTAATTITSTTSYTCTPYITYRLNGGSWATVNGTNPSGNTWNFVIPGQSSGTLIEYFITACNAAGTTTSPSGVTTSSASGSFHEYQIDCVPASGSGTQVVAFQGFEFVGSSYTFSVPNTSSTPTGLQNYAAHPSVQEWGYYNKGANGSENAANRNSCGCMEETFSGLPGCPNATNPIYTAGGSSGICRAYSGNSRGVYGNTVVTENPADSRRRNGNYSYIQISRNDGGEGPLSFIYLDDIAIPDAANATNIKVVAYVSSISTSTMSNGADAADFVELNVKYNSSNTTNSMVSDLTCGSDWYFFSSSAYTSVTGTSNSVTTPRWDYLGNVYNTSGTVSGTTTKNKLSITVPNGTTNVRALIRILNDDADNNELWAVDDIQIIADYPVVSAKRYYRSRQSGKWSNSSTWERASDITFSDVENACTPPDNSNSDTIIVLNGDTVRIQSTVSADQIYVAAGGKLTYTTSGNLTFTSASNSIELRVDGTYQDDAISFNSVTFSSGATWQLGAAGVFIKTNNSSAGDYRDNYHSGMSNIPATAHWYVTSLGGTTNPSFTTNSTYYPNLYFTSTSGTWNTGSVSSRFNGSNGYPTVKGNMTVGGGGGNVVVYSESINPQPILVLKNVNILSGSTFTNAGNTSAEIGTGLDIKGNLKVDGTLSLDATSTNNTNGILRFSGTGRDTLSGSGTINVNVLQIQKTAQTVLNLERNLTVNDSLQFTSGIINTKSNVLRVAGTNRTGAVTGHDAPYTSTSGTPSYANDKYIIGNLERNVTGTGLYEFPIGDTTTSEGYNPVRLNIRSGSPTGYATAKFTAGDPGKFASPPFIDNFTCGGSTDFAEYRDMTSEGWWNFTSSTSTSFNYDIYLHPNQNNLNVYPNDNSNPYVNNYRALKAPSNSAGVNFDWNSYASSGDRCVVGSYYNIVGANYTGFSDFAPAGGNNLTTALPVELLYFTATPVRNQYIQLDWATAIEINNLGFEVQRSEDGLNFTPIGWVDGHNNSTTQQYYTLDDLHVALDVLYYYRLKQFDYDGVFEYSDIVAARINGDKNSVTISEFMPNPTTGNSLLLIYAPKEDIVNIRLYNYLGQVVKEINQDISKGNNTVQLDLNDVASATYSARIQLSDYSVSKKVLVAK